MHAPNECGPIPDDHAYGFAETPLGKVLQLDRRLSLVRHLFTHA